MGEYYRIQLSALEGFELAVARLDMTGVFTYLNPAARRLFRVADDVTLEVQTLFPSETEHQKIRDQLLKRSEGMSSNYETHFRHVGATQYDAEIPVSVYAFPDTTPDGEVTGSIVIVRDLREEHARAAIHRAMEQQTRNAPLLDEVACQLRKLVDIDELRITAISKSRGHVRRVYSTDVDSRKKFPQHWWPMPAFVQRSLAKRVTGIIDLDKMRTDPDYAQLIDSDPATRRFFESGVRQVLSVPVRHDGIVVAFLSLDSRSDDRFTAETMALMDRLPLADVVMTALHRTESSTHKSVLDLIHRLGTKATNARQVVDALVSSLGKTFEWNHVSMFQREPGSGRLRLISQSNHGHTAFPDEFSLDCIHYDSLSGTWVGKGPLGEAIRTQVLVHRRDSLADGPFAQLTDGDRPNGSSLTMPVTGSKTEWVLYVESEMQGCFAQEEEELLGILAVEAASVLDKSAVFELQGLVLGAINDAVIETNNDGSIRWANEAAQEIFGLDELPKKCIMIDDLLDDAAEKSLLLKLNRFSHEEVHLRMRDGRIAPGLLSAATLPEHLSGRVYVASDVTFQRGAAQLDLLRIVFRHAALEARNPLAMAAVWLQQCGAGERINQSTIDKITRQLERADLPLERLMRLARSATGRIPVCVADLREALMVTLNELPGSMLEGIDRHGDKAALPVTIDFNDLQFCVESMIAFGLRTRPQSRMLKVSSGCTSDDVIFTVSGDWTPDTGLDPDNARDRWKRKTVYDLTLGESVIEDIVERAGGSFRSEMGQGFALEIRLPLHTGGTS